VRDVVDSQGNILNHLSYDSFGNVTGESNPDVDFRFGYTGREFDEETGQYYYRARYYDSGVGRFISEDPIGFDAGDPNLYRYVLNSPANYTDPSGNNALGDAYNSFLTSDVTQYSGHFWERAVSLTAYALVESGYFIQVSLLPDLNKMMLKDGDPLSAVIPIAENCPEYWLLTMLLMELTSSLQAFQIR
jgi:RHS repeat-associated protein